MASNALEAQGQGSATKMRVFDCDGHVMEAFSTWAEYIEPEFRQAVIAAQMGFLGTAPNGERSPDEAIRTMNYDEGADVESFMNSLREGGWNGSARLLDMDLEGMDTAALYPTALLAWVEDPELFDRSCRAYNDWLHDYCSADPQRLIGVGIVPVQDMDRARAEMRRCVEQLGFRAIMIRPAPYIGTAKLNEAVYDPFWREACDLGVGIGIHPFPFGDMNNVCRGLRLDAGMRLPTDDICIRQGLTNALDVMVVLAWFVAGGICERFPDLQVAFLEGSGGWLPTMLERLEHHFHVFGSSHQTSSPTELFKRQCYISFDPDECGLPFTADAVGADRILWASDYPHPDARIPGTVAELREAIETLSASDQELILGENAARFYGV